MTHRCRLTLTMVTTAYLACTLTACTSSGRVSKSESTDTPSRSNGTSAVVLVDFSKSFVPLTTPDERALHDIANGMTKLAKDEWSPPISVRQHSGTARVHSEKHSLASVVRTRVRRRSIATRNQRQPVERLCHDRSKEVRRTK